MLTNPPRSAPSPLVGNLGTSPGGEARIPPISAAAPTVPPAVGVDPAGQRPTHLSFRD